ncbi:MAG: M28 family peptidase [Pseudomonadota bacterium]|nr:M28 family peptidase [Pseudomonadota bacterium]
MAIESNRGLILAGAGIAVLLAATLLAYRTPAALGPTVSPAVFSASRAQAILEDLVGDDAPHPIGSAANAKVRERIVKRLTALGFTTELQTGLVCNDFGECGTPTNIVATYGGDAVRHAVLLAAHYDSVGAGPGASDDGAGVASLLEIARILTVMPVRRHPIVLLVTDGEEAGLLGALLFTREHRLAAQVWAAVNMEARGVSGPSLMFETGTANAWLMHRYAAATPTPITNSLFYVVYKTLPNNTDFTVFKAASYQGFNFAFIGDVAHYHTPLDSYGNTSASTLQHQGDNALSAVLTLTDSADLHPPAQDSVFFDVLARGVIVWPTALILPASLVAWMLLMAQAVMLFRRGQLYPRQAAYGAIGALANVVVGGVLSLGVLALLQVLGSVPPMVAASWIAYPQPMHIGCAALALLSSGAVAAWLARRAGFWGFWFGGSVSIALLSIASAVAVPGASYVLLLAAFAAALAPLPCMRLLARGRTPSQGALEFAALAPGLLTLAVLLPLLLLMYSALGALAWPISTMALCLTGCFLLPLLANATHEARQFIMYFGAAVTLVVISITLLLPMYSPAWPQRMNVEYWVDADRGMGHWWLQAASQHLPHAMADAAQFDRVPRARFAGYPVKGFFADAPALKLAAPELTQISATPGTSPAGAHFELLVRSARGAPTGFVVFPAGADVQNVFVATNSGPLRAKLHKFRNGDTVLVIAGMPSEGMRFGIDAAATPIPVRVFDESYGLPEALPEGKALQRARPQNATSSQDGDVTVVQRTVRLDPAAGR